MIYITHVRMSPPNSNQHEHISEVAWREDGGAKSGTLTLAQIVKWIDVDHGTAKVTDGKRTAGVVAVHGSPPHIRTVADGVYTNNLLALPRF